MIVKYKVTDFAKDTGLPVRKILDTLAAIGIEGKKNSSTLEEKDLNALLDRLSRDNSEADLSAFLNSGKAEPVKEKEAPKAAKQPAAQQPKAAKNGDSAVKQAPQAAAKNNGSSNNNNNGNNSRKNQNQPHKKKTRTSPTRSGTKRPSPSASWPGRPAPRPPQGRLWRSSGRATR